MDESLVGLGELLAGRKVAALGTLHDTAPYVSMVPFALLEDGSAFLIHVSELSAHTQDMLTDPRVSLLITESEGSGSPLELARVTVLGVASQIGEAAAAYAPAMARYLDRFPDSAPMFEFADFSLFAIRPEALRWIGGFAGAQSLTPAEFADAIRTA
jgi:putative heme iron utilization protein